MGSKPLPIAVQAHLDQIGARLTAGIDDVVLGGGTANRQVRIERFREPRTRAETPLVFFVNAEPTPIVGRPLEVDWKDHTAEIHTHTGIVSIAFPDYLDEEMRRSARRVVCAAGESIPGSKRTLVEWLEVDPSDDLAFWEPVPLGDPGPFRYELASPDEERGPASELLAEIFGQSSHGNS